MLLKAKKIDWSIVAILLLFMIISAAMVYSGTVDDPILKYRNMHIKTVFYFLLGFLVLFGVSFMNYKFFIKYAAYFYSTGVLLLIAVRFFGQEYNGAKSWFKLAFGFNFQPAEFMKLLLIIGIAAFIARRKGEQLQLVRDVIPIGILTFIPFVLVLVQPDLGNAIIYLVILLGMLWIGNIKYSYVLIGTALIIACFVLFFYLYGHFHDQIKDFLVEKENGHWVERIDTFIDPENATDDASYQVRKSKIAIGSGGLTGDKYLQGNSIHNRFVPLPYSDSVFVVVGEEFGFIGSAMLLLLYFLLIYRMILISIQCEDLSGAVIILGIVSMFVFQIFENIGMLLGIMPLTGITLPFVSYGGTSVLINMMCIGIVLSIKVHQEKLPDYP